MSTSSPSVTFNIIAPQQLAGVTGHRVLIVGQMLTGSATAGALTQNVGTKGEEDALFGARSHVAGMVREFRRINKETQVDVIAVDDAGAATQATGTIALSGTATEDGTLVFKVGSGAQHKYEIDVLTGDTADEVGTALAAAITADTKAPFTASNLTGTVTITAENAGTLANEWTLKYEGSVAGVTTTLTAFSGGASDPTITNVLDVVGDIRFNTIVWPSVYDLQVVTDFLDARFNVNNDVLDGVAIVHQHDSLANLQSNVSTLNSQSVSVSGTQAVDKTAIKGGSIVEFDDVLAARRAAVRSLRLTADANIAGILSVRGAPLDTFGGIALSTLPYANTLIQFTDLPDKTDVFVKEDQDELEENGVSSIGLNRAGNSVILGQQVTTYLTDNAGNPDSTFKFLNAVDSSSVIREYFFENNKARYAQSRLTDGDLVRGRSIENATSIRAFQKRLYTALSEEAVTQAGLAAIKNFDEGLTVEPDVRTGRVTINSAPLQVGQLRAAIGAIEVNFGG